MSDWQLKADVLTPKAFGKTLQILLPDRRPNKEEKNRIQQLAEFVDTEDDVRFSFGN